MRGPFEGFDVPCRAHAHRRRPALRERRQFVYENPQPQGDLTVTGGETGKQTSLLAVGAQNPRDDPSLALRKGQARHVCIAFEVPKGKRPRTFEYTADAGTATAGCGDCASGTAPAGSPLGMFHANAAPDVHRVEDAHTNWYRSRTATA